MEFARALGNRTGVGADDVEATLLAPAPSGPRHAKRPAAPRTQRRRRRAPVALAILLSLIAVAAVVFLALYERHEGRVTATRTSQTSTQATGNVALPVIVVGADCATLGGAGVTESGDPAYCARLASSGAPIWSLYPGEVPHPTGVSESDAPVLVCMQQTGQNQVDCHNDILQENTDPGANDKSS